MPYDYGFEMKDTRETFFVKGGGEVNITIVRHWKQDEEDDDASFEVSFNLTFKSKDGQTVTIPLPIRTTLEQASEVAHVLWEEDKEETKAHYDLQAMYEAERRMGA